MGVDKNNEYLKVECDFTKHLENDYLKQVEIHFSAQGNIEKLLFVSSSGQ